VATFRFASKKVFLTYPQCPLTCDELYSRLSLNLPPASSYTIGREQHQDGNTHLHALWVCHGRIETRNERFFDIHYDNNVYHPNIVVPRSVKAVDKYCRKDGDFISNAVNADSDDWSTIVNESGGSRDYLGRIRKSYPRVFATQLQNLEYSASKLFQSEPIPYTSDFTEFLPPEECLEWASQYLYRPHPGGRLKSLYIEGPTRTGKTEWARSLGPHIYFNNMYNLSTFITTHSSAEYIIFDDIPFERLPAWKGFCGCQLTFSFADKYQRKFTVESWGKPSIFIVNPDMSYNGYDHRFRWEYFRDNCVVCTTSNKFFA